MRRYALIDGNNFFVSCERSFNPRLQGKPVVVLSNNDGCVIARSDEAKALGIQMAQPYFQVKKLIQAEGVQVFSANFELYRDMHHRMIALLRKEVRHLEVYSIDEAFLDFSDTPCDYDLHADGVRIRDLLNRALGLPVSIGFAPTKTLAKAANYFAKKVLAYHGVVNLCNFIDYAVFLKYLPLAEVWGIGRRHGQRLHAMGLENAYQFTKLSSRWVRQHMAVTGLRVHQELQGIACYDLDVLPTPKQSRLVSRSFAHSLTGYEDVKKAINFFITRAAEKLRADRQVARAVSVYITTNRHSAEPFYQAMESEFLLDGTDNTITLLAAASQAYDRIYKAGFAYKKAGIILHQLEQHAQQQHSFTFVRKTPWKNDFMKVLDSLNKRYGQDTLYFGALDPKNFWRPEKSLLSPRYSTRLSEVLCCF